MILVLIIHMLNRIRTHTKYSVSKLNCNHEIILNAYYLLQVKIGGELLIQYFLLQQTVIKVNIIRNDIF
jgi:hypothetical protein